MILPGMSSSWASEKKKKKAVVSTPVVAKKEIKKESAYEKLLRGKNCESVRSKFISLHRVDGKLYFEFPLVYFGKEMLLSSAPSEVSNNFWCNIGLKEIEHIKFTQEDTIVSLRSVNSATTYNEAELSIGKAIRQNTLDPILETYKILAFNPDSTAVVFDVTALFTKDHDLLPLFPRSMGMYGIIARPGKAATFLKEIKSFDDNLTIKSSMSYNMSLSFLLFTLARENVTVTATRSILLLPEEKMRPRVSDSRVGIFLTNKEYISTEEDQIQNYSLAHRWRIEPKDAEAYKRGELVEPVKPIVFYVDDAFPELWKEPIKEGTLRWNKAFEKIGFKNVVQVRDFPKDDPTFDPDNLKYSCIRYIPSSTENAMGPSFVDPSTGEIMNASVLVYNDIIKLINNWRFIQTAQVDPSVRTKKMPDEIVKESIAYVVAHEVGHTLGFMHNMAASAAYPVDSLRSASFTRKYGTTPSIMDYARYNYVAQPGDKGVKLTPPDLGIYDEFLVRWNYLYFPEARGVKEETALLEKLVDEKAGDPKYRYGCQQIYSRYDPSSIEEDLGDNPIKASEYGIKNLQYILKHMDEWIDNDPDGSHKSELLNQLVNQYYRYIRNVMYNVGGIYLTRVKEGTEGKRYEAVPKEVQKASLLWTMKQFRTCDWINNKGLKEKLPLSVNYSEILRNALANTLKNAYNGVILSSHVSKDPYTVSEFFADYYQGVFESTIQGRRLTDGDKLLQTVAVDLVTETFEEPKKGGGLFGITTEDNAFAPSVDDMVAYGLDETGLMKGNLEHLREVEKEQGFGYVAKQMEMTQFSGGYGWQRKIKLTAIDRSKTNIHALAMKMKRLLESKIPTVTGETKEHYEALLFTLNKTLNK